MNLISSDTISTQSNAMTINGVLSKLVESCKLPFEGLVVKEIEKVDDSLLEGLSGHGNFKVLRGFTIQMPGRFHEYCEDMEDIATFLVFDERVQLYSDMVSVEGKERLHLIHNAIRAHIVASLTKVPTPMEEAFIALPPVEGFEDARIASQ